MVSDDTEIIELAQYLLFYTVAVIISALTALVCYAQPQTKQKPVNKTEQALNIFQLQALLEKICLLPDELLPIPLKAQKRTLEIVKKLLEQTEVK